MSLIKWNSIDNQFPRFPSIFDDFFGHDPFEGLTPRFSKPAINVREDDDKYLITLGIPGIAKDDCTLEVEDGMLRISCQNESRRDPQEGDKYSRYEYNYSSFQQSFAIPDNVDAESIEAKHENGELSITLPKTGESPGNKKVIDIN